MGEVVVVGAGMAGLGAALVLGRRGRRVVVLERDPAPVPADPEAMWAAWPRPGTPHAPLSHAFGPRFHALLRRHAPDVLARLWDAGVLRVDLAEGLPGDARPEDADLISLWSRRAVVEGVLRRAVEAEPTVDLRAGCGVAGLLAEPPGPDGLPRVGGVRLAGGGALAAETVVVAGGRRAPIGRWLAAIGAPPPEEESEGCGFQWYTRYFRLLPGAEGDGALPTVALTDFGYAKHAVVRADRDTFCLEFAAPVWDKVLHRFRDEAAFMAAQRAMPAAAPWLGPTRAEPIGPVAVMGQEQTLLRHFLRAGRPLALGLHVIGDARARTNSDYAWGATLALRQAVAVADALAAHPGDPEAQALAFEAAMGEELEGRYRLSLARDRACRRFYRGEMQWDPDDGGEGFIQSVVVPAGREDPDLARALRRRGGQLDPVDALPRNAALLERARALAAARPPQPAPAPPAGPTREELLAVIAAAAPENAAR